MAITPFTALDGLNTLARRCWARPDRARGYAMGRFITGFAGKHVSIWWAARFCVFGSGQACFRFRLRKDRTLAPAKSAAGAAGIACLGVGMGEVSKSPWKGCARVGAVI